MRTEFCWGSALKRDHQKDQEDGNVTLRWMSGRQFVRTGGEWK
jgi:hypothetical protein